MNQGKTFEAYLNEVLDEHVVAEDEEQVVLNVTPKEAEAVGLFTIRTFAGLARGLKRVRFLFQLMEVEAQAGVTTVEGWAEVEEGESEEAKALVN
jgi:hypothetical protein